MGKTIIIIKVGKNKTSLKADAVSIRDLMEAKRAIEGSIQQLGQQSFEEMLEPMLKDIAEED